MRIAMPSIPESLSYAVVAAIGITVLAAIVRVVAGPGNIVAGVLLLAFAALAIFAQGSAIAPFIYTLF